MSVTHLFGDRGTTASPAVNDYVLAKRAELRAHLNYAQTTIEHVRDVLQELRCPAPGEEHLADTEMITNPDSGVLAFVIHDLYRQCRSAAALLDSIYTAEVRR